MVGTDMDMLLLLPLLLIQLTAMGTELELTATQPLPLPDIMPPTKVMDTTAEHLRTNHLYTVTFEVS